MKELRKNTFLHFSMPSGVFVIAPRSLSCLVTSQEGKLTMLGQGLLSVQERCVVLPLFEHFPTYCPYEVMHASYYRGDTYKKTIVWSCQCLKEAKKVGRWGLELKPIRYTIYRVRKVLRLFDLDVLTIPNQGYLLRYRA